MFTISEKKHFSIKIYDGNNSNNDGNFDFAINASGT